MAGRVKLGSTGLRKASLGKASLGRLNLIVRIAGRTRLIALAQSGGEINALGALCLIAAGLLRLGDEILRLGLLLVVLLLAIDE